MKIHDAMILLGQNGFEVPRRHRISSEQSINSCTHTKYNTAVLNMLVSALYSTLTFKEPVRRNKS